MIFNVKDFGATGDGVTIDSPFVQKALDTCKEQGGGTVYFPTGKYVCASMRIYSNTCVELSAGCVIISCDDESQYGHLRGKYDEPYTRSAGELAGKNYENFEDNDDLSNDWMPRCFIQHLRNKTDNIFCAINAENVTIKGEGTINGRQMNFFYNDTAGEDQNLPRWMRHPGEIAHFLPHLFRPQTIVYYGCKNAKISGIKMINPPFFNVKILDSVDVHVDGVYIDGDPRCINSDGINITGSKNVFVDSCFIRCGDDCIAVSTGEFTPRIGNCENVVVSNCIFDTGSNMTRIFCGIDIDPALSIGIELPGDTKDIARGQSVRNVSFTNCIMLGGSCAANINSAYGGIENVRITNLQTNHTHHSPVVFIGALGESEISNININGINATSHAGINVLGAGGGKVHDIYLSNISMTVSPMTSVFGMAMPDNMNDYWALEYGPYNVNFRHVDNVVLDNITLNWGEEDLDDLEELCPDYLSPFYKKLWREDMNAKRDWPAVYGFDCNGFTVTRLHAKSHGNCDAVCFENCTDTNY